MPFTGLKSRTPHTLAQISLVRTMKGASDSDRRESSVPTVKGLSDTHDSLRSLCVAP